METVLILLGSAVLAFTLVKTTFGFLSWIFPEADEYYRANLDGFFDALDQMSLFDIGLRVLARLSRGLRSVLQRPLRVLLIFGFLCFALNAGVFVFTSMNVIDSYSHFFGWGVEDLLDAIEDMGWVTFTAMTISVAVLGTFFDLISATVTVVLLNRASHSGSSLTLGAHLLLDIFVAILACMWAYAILDVVIRFFYNEILITISSSSGVDTPSKYLKPTLSETLDVLGGLWAVVIWLGISTALPTVVYLLTVLPVLVLRAVPGVVQRGLSRIVFLITTDRQPVLKQIATFSSHAGALVAAIVAWMSLAST